MSNQYKPTKEIYVKTLRSLVVYILQKYLYREEKHAALWQTAHILKTCGILFKSLLSMDIAIYSEKNLFALTFQQGSP